MLNKQQATSNKQQATSNKQQFYRSFPKFLKEVIGQGQQPQKVRKAYFLVSVFALLMGVSIQCGGGPSSDATTPPDGGSGQFNPICTNGTPSPEKVSTANTQKCISCDPGFDLNGEICGGFDTICPNGIPAPPEKVSKANTQKCISCNSYHALKSDKSCAVVTVETLAGTGSQGFMDGVGTTAQFNSPGGVAVDAGVVYVADTTNNRIRTITLFDRMVETLADDGTTTQFRAPAGITVDAGVVYMTASSGTVAHKITLPTPTNNMASVSSVTASATCKLVGGDVVVYAGNVYISDYNKHRICKIPSSGNMVETFAGSTIIITKSNGDMIDKGDSGHVDDIGTTAKFRFPVGIAVDSAGVLYVADSENHRIRTITISTQKVTTLAGSSSGYKEGKSTDARFNNPFGVAVYDGIVYVADRDNHRIRRIRLSNGMVDTLAGSGRRDFMDGAGNVAWFDSPVGVAVDDMGNVYVADRGNHRIRKITIPK